MIPVLSALDYFYGITIAGNEKESIAASFSLMVIQGYTDFIFINRFGHVQHQGTLNKALRRIIRDCNDEVLSSGQIDPILLPHFSCHNLRHSFTTRMIEAKISPKVVQEALGHSDISTTMNIYADVTRELMTSEFDELNGYFKSKTLKNIV